MKKSLLIQKSNGIGAIASFICLVHCMVTPLLFIVQACSSSCCESSPVWWQWLDYIFLIIAFFAVNHAARFTTKKIIAKGLWLSWMVLFFVIVNEKMQFLALPRYTIYFPTLSLIFLHIYNQKFCHCKTDQCCTSKTEKL